MAETFWDFPASMASKSQTKRKVSAMSEKQKYAEILDDPDAILRIQKWVSEHRNGLKSRISAFELATQLEYPELNRELVVLRDIRLDDDTSFNECVLKGLKKKGVRKKLLPELAATVFGRDPRDVFNRLISFSDLEGTLRGLSVPVEAVAQSFSCEKSNVEDQAEALFGALDALFASLEKMDLERKLIILRIVCLVHLTFVWSAQVDAGSDITEQVGRRFLDYLGVPDSERSLSRLKKDVGKIVSRILSVEQPLSVLIPEFEDWWRSLFLEIDMRGEELLKQLNPGLSNLPGDPFQLADDSDDPHEQADMVDQAKGGEEDEDDLIIEDADEDGALEVLDPGGAIEKVETVDPIDRATSEAEALGEAPPTERSKEVQKYFDNLSAHVTPLEYDHYKGLPISELRRWLFEAKLARGKIGDICSMLENEISRREKSAGDSGGGV